jgi:hypothetical protein
VKTGFSLARSLVAYGPLLGAAASLFQARGRGGLLHALKTGWSLWQVVRRLARLWGSRPPEAESSR